MILESFSVGQIKHARVRARARALARSAPNEFKRRHKLSCAAVIADL